MKFFQKFDYELLDLIDLAKAKTKSINSMLDEKFKDFSDKMNNFASGIGKNKKFLVFFKDFIC
jgi:hypothetical protein